MSTFEEVLKSFSAYHINDNCTEEQRRNMAYSVLHETLDSLGELTGLGEEAQAIMDAMSELWFDEFGGGEFID